MRFIKFLFLIFVTTATYCQDRHDFVKVGSGFTYQNHRSGSTSPQQVLQANVSTDSINLTIFFTRSWYVNILSTDTITANGTIITGNLIHKRDSLITSIFPAIGSTAYTGTSPISVSGSVISISSSPSFTAPTISGVVIPSISSTNTFSNKRWKPRMDSVSSASNPTINSDNVDIFKITAQAGNLASFTTNFSGTPFDGQVLEIEITGTSTYTLAWGSAFVSSTVTLPTTVSTVTSTTVIQYFSNSSYGNGKWVCVNSF